MTYGSTDASGAHEDKLGTSAEWPIPDELQRRFLRTASDKVREIWSTEDKDILELHREVITELRYRWEPVECVTGAELLCSPFRHARRHRGNGNFFTLDIKDAYPNTSIELVKHMLQLYMPDQWSDDLDPYFFHPSGKGLLTGMPASPTLFNLACQPLDTMLLLVCERYGLTYSRYLDDCVFSSPLRAPIPKVVRKELRGVFAEESWPINERKTRLMSHRRGPVVLTGIQLNESGSLRPTRSFTRRARAVIDAAGRGEESFSRAAGYAGALIAASSDKLPNDVQNALAAFRRLREQGPDEFSGEPTQLRFFG